MTLPQGDSTWDTPAALAWRNSPEGLRIGFDIGWDHGAHGVPVFQKARLDADSLRQVMMGAREGAKHPSRKPLDRFIVKWLHLRFSAWSRGRVFDEGVTPDYLERIDPPNCPIIRAPLVHPMEDSLTPVTAEELDDFSARKWSVDRALNDGGYARGNLVIMSRLANNAKGSLSPEDILDLVRRGGSHRGLNAAQWARMAAMTQIVSNAEDVLPLILMPPPRLLIVNRHIPLQVMLSYAASGFGFQKASKVVRGLLPGKKLKREMDEFMGIIAGRMMSVQVRIATHDLNRHIEDIWVDGVLLDRFKKLIDGMGPALEMRCTALLRQSGGMINLAANDITDHWGMDSQGYATPQIANTLPPRKKKTP